MPAAAPDTRRHRCPECGAVFTRVHNMRAHRALHDPHRPKLLCERAGCGATFFRRNDLLRHERAHDVRPHACPEEECGKAFARDAHLDRHLAHCEFVRRRANGESPPRPAARKDGGGARARGAGAAAASPRDEAVDKRDCPFFEESLDVELPALVPSPSALLTPSPPLSDLTTQERGFSTSTQEQGFAYGEIHHADELPPVTSTVYVPVVVQIASGQPVPSQAPPQHVVVIQQMQGQTTASLVSPAFQQAAAWSSADAPLAWGAGGAHGILGAHTPAALGHYGAGLDYGAAPFPSADVAMAGLLHAGGAAGEHELLDALGAAGVFGAAGLPLLQFAGPGGWDGGGAPLAAGWQDVGPGLAWDTMLPVM